MGTGRMVEELHVDYFCFPQKPRSEAIAINQVTSLFYSLCCRLLVDTYLFEIE